ncbi:MAG: STY4851/ECs_5259 family protein [Myxococcota bacterium]
MGGEEYIDLSRLEDGELGEIFEQKRNDPRFLEALNRELNQRESDEALELQFEVVKARRIFARVLRPTTHEQLQQQSGPVRDWLRTFLSAREIQRPNSRPLYRYRMTDREFERANEILRYLASQGRLAVPDDRSGALFVAFCSEWFRRESISTFLRWNDPAPDLFPTIPDSAKRDLADRGLRYWRRELRRSDSGREFLLTVALEGGFPVRILTSGARAWLRDYLRSIMRRAIASRVDTLQEILEIAEEERGRMRKSYQHDDFVALCSELVERLLDLRRSAEAEGAGTIRNSALLDIRRPGWREDLPIYVPAQDEALVAELLTGLLDEKMTGLSTDGVEARRYLVKCDGQWVSALQLLADGEIPPQKLPNLPTQGRVRAVPTGELGKHLSGELALLEAPIGEQRRWRVLPFTRTAKLLKNFPFTSPVTATLTSPDVAPCPWTWPHGEPLRSDLLVFRDDEGSTAAAPLLRFFRSGSVSSPVKTLHVLFPDDWTIEPTSEGAVVEVESLPHLNRKLARLVGTAYFRGGESEAIRFRVEPDTEGREHELEFPSGSTTGFDLADEQCELVVSPADPLIRDGGKQPRPPRAGELFSRRPGGKWVPLSSRIDGAGLTEFSLRDPEAGVQIERRLVALFPIGARISGTMNDARRGQIRMEGLPDWTASIANAACEVDQVNATTLSFKFLGHPLYRLPMMVRPAVGQPFEIVVPLMGRDAAIALADGSVLEPGAQVDLGTLRGAVAISPRRTVLHVTAKGAKSGGLSAAVDGELPLGVLRSAIDEILTTLPAQDDLAELEFVGDTRLPIRISRYRNKQLAHDGGIVSWSEASSSPEVMPVARMVLDPRHEHALEQEADGLWRVPERCKGLCLVYLRQGVDVVSRPLPVPRLGSPDAHAGNLVSALTIADYENRQAEIGNALRHIVTDVGGVSWLLEAATHLNGLPANAFDALKLLPSCPQALVGLLLSARDAGERGTIWSLQNELPFLWLGLPLSAWRAALEADYSAVSTALEPIFGAGKAAVEALGRLATLRAELAALEPALACIFSLTGIATVEATRIPSLNDLTGAYVASQIHRSSEGRNDLAARLEISGLKLPSEILTKSHEDFDGLFAPILLAASAQGRLTIKRDLALLARRTLRENPAYVSGAYAHLLKFYGSK